MRTRKNIKTMRIDNKRLRMIVSESVRRTLTEMAQQRMPDRLFRTIAQEARDRYGKNDPHTIDYGDHKDGYHQGEDEIEIEFSMSGRWETNTRDLALATVGIVYGMEMYSGCRGRYPYPDEEGYVEAELEDVKPEVTVLYYDENTDKETEVRYILTDRQREYLASCIHVAVGDYVGYGDEDPYYDRHESRWSDD